MYGLSDLTNVRKWHAAFREGADPHRRLAFEAELRTYFGVAKYYVQKQIRPAWRGLYSMPDSTADMSTKSAVLTQILPANGSLGSAAGDDKWLSTDAVAYWQWGLSYPT